MCGEECVCVCVNGRGVCVVVGDGGDKKIFLLYYFHSFPQVWSTSPPPRALPHSFRSLSPPLPPNTQPPLPHVSSTLSQKPESPPHQSHSKQHLTKQLFFALLL